VTHDNVETQAGGGWRSALFAPVDASFLAYFRSVFGLTILGYAMIYIGVPWAGNLFEKVDTYFVDPDFHFSYYGFGWVKPLPGVWMHFVFALLAVLACCVTVGLFYRKTVVLLFALYTYVFLLDKAYFVNHYYLLCLFAFLMCLMPAHCAFSVDARRKSAIRSKTVAAWTLWLLRAQIAVPYFYGGLSKINDDWLHGEPIRKWLYTGQTGAAQIFHNEIIVKLISYGGLLLDLLVVPLLLWRRTRVYTYVIVVVFNICNSLLFNIGVFPWFILLSSLLFFPPDWPRSLAERLQSILSISSVPAKARENQIVRHAGKEKDNFSSEPTPALRRRIIGFLAVYLGFQLLWPLRHHCYEGNPAWNEKGDLFAWRMMLYDKQFTALKFYVAEADDPASVDNLDRRVELPGKYINETLNHHQLFSMGRRPDLILQFSHHLAKQLRETGGRDFAVYALAAVSFNSRDAQLLVDPEVNLAAVERTIWGPTPWIMLFENTPRRRHAPKSESDGT